MSEATIELIPMDKLAKIYRKIKAEIDQLTQEYDDKIERLKAQQNEVRFAMQDQMKVMGVKSVNTAFGTVSMVMKTRYNTQDWDSFKKFIIDNDVVDLLEKRIAQTNMARFLEENPGKVPPGLNSTSEFEIRVTKPTK
jgi:glutathione peroxidase-family protein